MPRKRKKIPKTKLARSVGRPINTTLNAENIDKLVNYCKGVKYGIRAGTADALEKDLARRTIIYWQDLIRDNIQYGQFHTGELMDSCVYELTSGAKGERFRLHIRNTSPAYKYFEYGTGMIGEESDKASEALSAGWEYCIGPYSSGSELLKNQPAGTFPIIKNDTIIGVTQGQPAKMLIPQVREYVQATLPSTLAKNITIRKARVNTQEWLDRNGM